MNAHLLNPHLRSLPQTSAATAWEEPLHFSSGSRLLFGWLHHPSGEMAGGWGVVICKPFGFESVCSYLAVRDFATTSTALGMPTMRFDYAGTGDSEDLDPSADQIAVWTDDIVAAVAELRSRTGVERVCLLGFRLGALLAALAAPRCTGAAALIAVAPIVSGRRYLKELRNFELAAGHIGAAAAAGAAQAASGDGGNFEVSGFVLSGATVAALSQLDLANLVGAPVPELLIIDRNDSTAGRAWSDQLAGLGVKTGYRALPGFVEMMMRPPDLTVTPAAMIEATREWLTALQESTTTTAADTVRPAGSLSASATPAARPLPAPAPAQAMPVECPVFFGSDILLFGIITEPPKEEARRRGVILLNSGGDYHIGPRRMYVSLARTWARRGYFVLRMDLSGLGDSARRSGRPGNEIFPPGAIEDIEAGVEFMRARHGLREITVGGMCTGAFHALQAAAEGLPINRILMINPLNFFWEEGAEPTAVQDWEIVQKPAAYRSQMFSAHAWRRVLSGDVNLWRVLKIYLHSPWLALQTRLRDLARRLNIPVGNDLAELLESIAARGVRIVFVFSDGDAGINLLKTQSGMPVEALSKRYRFRIIAGADHNFTRSEPRSALERVLSEELFARNQQEPV